VRLMAADTVNGAGAPGCCRKTAVTRHRNRRQLVNSSRFYIDLVSFLTDS
jgi:hypothetical protein